MIEQWKKKPVVISACQFDGMNQTEIMEWVGRSAATENDNIYIITLEGAMKLSVGDYLIKGVQGEFYPCKPDIFVKTYERADKSYLDDLTTMSGPQ